MLTQENDVEIHALAARGWNQSAISRHTGRDRKTVRRYLAAGEEPVAREAAASCLEPWLGCVGGVVGRGRRRVWLAARRRGENAPTTEIDHPPGEEIQWDWLELHTTP